VQKPVTAFHAEAIGPLDEEFAASPSPRRPRWGLAIGGVFLLAIVVFVLVFQWNWLRGPLASLLSARLHRPVAIAGDLEVHPWSLSPTLVINDMTVGNPSWAGGGVMARLPRLTAQVRLPPLLGGNAIFPFVEADRPDVRLVSDVSGRANWKPDGEGAAARPAPPIGHLVIRGGRIGLTDVLRRIGFSGEISADETATRGGYAGATKITGALVVANPPWAGPGPLARAPRLVIETQLLSGMRDRRLALNLVEADGPDVRLVRDASGRENWRPTGGAKPRPLKLPPIGRLLISNGRLRYDDAGRPLHFLGTISSSERMTGAGNGVFELAGQGVLNRSPFFAIITGGPLIDVDRSRPYRFNARLQAGATKVAMVGAVAHPFDFSRLSGTLSVSGQDLSELNTITGLALPMSPPYALAGGFSRVGAFYALRRLHGRVGDSDLAGALSVDDSSGRPFLAADLASRRLRLVDLAPAFGGAPRNPAGHVVSPAERVIGARLRAEHRVLPDTPLNVTRVRGMDAKVAFTAQSVVAGKLLLHSLDLKLVLDHGVLTLAPVAIGLSQGDLSGSVRIDARGNTPFTTMDVRVANARLERLISQKAGPPPLEGGLFGRARLSGAGASVRSAAAGANGEFSLVVPGGEIRQALAELLGIDATKGLFLLLTKNENQTPIRCGVADFQARDGVLSVRRIVLDTGVVLVAGAGDIDMRNETIDLRLAGKPKKFRLIRIAAPITVKGRWEAPKLGVDVGKAAGQLAVSGLLGALVSPAALLLPFVSPGLAHNADCAALVAAAHAEGDPSAAGAR